MIELGRMRAGFITGWTEVQCIELSWIFKVYFQLMSTIFGMVWFAIILIKKVREELFNVYIL